MYSDIVLTDDNFDEELEKLCDSLGINYHSYNSFINKLDDSFSLQLNNGKEEWISYKTIPNKSSDFKQAFQNGQLAYEFGNGFMLFDYETVL